MNTVDMIAYAIMILLVLLLVYIIVGLIMKFTARYRKDFWFFYYGIPRHVKCPNCLISKYFNRFPDSDLSSIKY
jgi:hypothetical protein